jgi:hypothetical protein
MSRRPAPGVRNHLPAVLRRRGISWGELGRRTLLTTPLLGRLRAPSANPRLAVAERVAAALGVPVERLWTLVPPRDRARG